MNVLKQPRDYAMQIVRDCDTEAEAWQLFADCTKQVYPGTRSFFRQVARELADFFDN